MRLEDDRSDGRICSSRGLASPPYPRRIGEVDDLGIHAPLGYVQLDARASELLFQILTEREEKSSIALATNLPFSEWRQVVPALRLVGAIVDRVTFNAHIIETGTESYRLRTTKARGRRKS
jgi:hypothetical protein